MTAVARYVLGQRETYCATELTIRDDGSVTVDDGCCPTYLTNADARELAVHILLHDDDAKKKAAQVQSRLERLLVTLGKHVHHQRGTGSQAGYIAVRTELAAIAQLIGEPA